MGKRTDKRQLSTIRAVRQVLQSEDELAHLSDEESAMLAGQLTDLVARVERLRTLGPEYAGLSVSDDVRQLLTRLEAGAGLATGVH